MENQEPTLSEIKRERKQEPKKAPKIEKPEKEVVKKVRAGKEMEVELPKVQKKGNIININEIEQVPFKQEHVWYINKIKADVKEKRALRGEIREEYENKDEELKKEVKALKRELNIFLSEEMVKEYKLDPKRMWAPDYMKFKYLGKRK